MPQTSVEMILVEDYLKYERLMEIGHDCFKSKYIHNVNYIEGLFDRLFDKDIDEYIDKNNLRK